MGFIVVSSDRGLCGGLNSNLFRKMVQEIKEQQKADIEPVFCTIGTKALGFFKRFGGNVMAQATHLGDNPHIEDLIGTVKVMLDAYESGEIDAIYVRSNVFVNTMTQDPTIMQLVPIHAEKSRPWAPLGLHLRAGSPSPCSTALLTATSSPWSTRRSWKTAPASKSARMVAMKSASDNAGNLIDELQLGLQQGPPGGDHPGNFRDRERRRRGLIRI